MEKIGLFISDEVKEQLPLSPAEYIAKEMRKDISLFPEDVQEIIRAKKSEKDIPPTEKGRYDRERNTWWRNKYGFNYDQKAARNEVVMRKYASPPERNAAHTLQDTLFDAYGQNDITKIAEIKKVYLERYPDQLEGVEAVFGLQQYFDDQKTLESPRPPEQKPEQRSLLYTNLTEYNYLLTDFIGSNGDDKAFLQKFWSVLEAIARNTDMLKMFQQLQRAIVTQVATGKIFEQIGEKPRSAHPSEDAFKAIDLWTEGAAIQIKGTDDKKAGFLKTDEISFPGVEITREDVKNQAKTYHINSHMFHEAQRFHAKLDAYRKLIKKDVQGYFLVVPYNKIDFITGEPAPELVEFVKEQVATELK